MGVLTWKGATAKEAARRPSPRCPNWAKEQGFADDPVAVEGATLFAESGCLNCHVYLGAGGQNLGAPELTEEGLKGRGIEWQVEHLKNPSSKVPGSPMPSFARSRRGEPDEDRNLPRGVEGPAEVTTTGS